MNTTLSALAVTPIPPEDDALRPAIRAFIAEHVSALSADRRARSWAGFDANFSRALGEAGFLGLTLPKAYGGHERSAFARYVVAEELLNAGAPVAAHWISDRQSAPLILKYGTEEQKQTHIPTICAGASFFCIGMSEPNSGSDLASVRTHARPDGKGGWRLNGQKIWTTHGHRCHYMIALVRTSGDANDRQKGLSQFIVDLSAPGVTTRPITDLTGDTHFSEVFFDNVSLSPDSLIGTEGNGWEQVVSELAFERSGPERFYTSAVLFETWLAFLRTQPNPAPSSIRLAGQIAAELSAIRALSLAVTGQLEAGASPIVEGALVKDMGTSVEQAIPIAIADELGHFSDAELPTELVGALRYTTLAAPSYSLRGGTRDILRGMIARGLGLR